MGCVSRRGETFREDVGGKNLELDIDLVTDLISRIEEMAYAFVQAGDRHAANTMFYAATELEKRKDRILRGPENDIDVKKRR